MDRHNEELRDKRARIEDIEEKISEKTAEIKRLSEELDDIYDMKMKSTQTYEEVLDYWKGEPGFKKLYEANEENIGLFRILVQKKEDAIAEAEQEKKRLIREAEDIT